MTDDEIYRMRHYGSCGHVVEYKSKKLYDKFSAPREVAGKLYMNPIEEQGGVKIVLVHPDRYCVCEGCILVDMALDKLDNLAPDEVPYAQALRARLTSFVDKLGHEDIMEVCGDTVFLDMEF